MRGRVAVVVVVLGFCAWQAGRGISYLVNKSEAAATFDRYTVRFPEGVLTGSHQTRDHTSGFFIVCKHKRSARGNREFCLQVDTRLPRRKQVVGGFEWNPDSLDGIDLAAKYRCFGYAREVTDKDYCFLRGRQQSKSPRGGNGLGGGGLGDGGLNEDGLEGEGLGGGGLDSRGLD